MLRTQKWFLVLILFVGFFAIQPARAMEQPSARPEEDLQSLLVRYEICASAYNKTLSYLSLGLDFGLSHAATYGLTVLAMHSGLDMENFGNMLGMRTMLKILTTASRTGLYLGGDKFSCLIPPLRKRRAAMQEVERVIRKKITDAADAGNPINLLPYLRGLQGASLELMIKIFKEGQPTRPLPAVANQYFEMATDMVPDEAWQLLLHLTDPDPEKLNERQHALGVILHGYSEDKKSLCQFIAHAAQVPLEFITAAELDIKMRQLVSGQDVLQDVRLKAAELNLRTGESKQSIIEQRRWVAAVAKLHVDRIAMEKERSNEETATVTAELAKIDSLLNSVVRGNKLLRHIQEIKDELQNERALLDYYAGNQAWRWYRWARSFVSDRADDYMWTQKSVRALEEELNQVKRDFDPIYKTVCREAKIAGTTDFENVYNKSNVGIMVVENINDLCQKGQNDEIINDPVADLLLEAMGNGANKNVVVVETTDSLSDLSTGLKSEERFSHFVEVQPLSERQRLSCLTKHASNVNIAPEVITASPQIAKKTDRFSQHDLQRVPLIAKEMAQRMAVVRNGSDRIREADISEAIDRVRTERTLRSSGNESAKNIEEELKKGAQWLDDDPKHAGSLPQAAQDAVTSILNKSCPKTRNGIFLYGPPGCGKTHDANYLAYITGCPIIRISGSMFGSKWYSVSQENVRKLFATIRKEKEKYRNLSPERKKIIRERRARYLPDIKNKDGFMMIVFIDEVSSLGRDRKLADNSGCGQEGVKTLDEFLTQTGEKSLNDLSDVMFIGATNESPDKFDEAFLDRLPYHVKVPLPGPEKRLAFCMKFLENGDSGNWERAAAEKICEIAFSPFAKGWSLRELENLVTWSVDRRESCNAHEVTLDHVSYAMGTIIKKHHASYAMENRNKKRKDSLLEEIQVVFDQLKLNFNAIPQEDPTEREEDEEQEFQTVAAAAPEKRSSASCACGKPEIPVQLTQQAAAAPAPTNSTRVTQISAATESTDLACAVTPQASAKLGPQDETNNMLAKILGAMQQQVNLLSERNEKQINLLSEQQVTLLSKQNETLANAFSSLVNRLPGLNQQAAASEFTSSAFSCACDAPKMPVQPKQQQDNNGMLTQLVSAVQQQTSKFSEMAYACATAPRQTVAQQPFSTNPVVQDSRFVQYAVRPQHHYSQQCE